MVFKITPFFSEPGKQLQVANHIAAEHASSLPAVVVMITLSVMTDRACAASNTGKFSAITPQILQVIGSPMDVVDYACALLMLEGEYSSFIWSCVTAVNIGCCLVRFIFAKTTMM